MPRANSIPSTPPPTWHTVPAMLDFSQDEHDDQHTTEGLAPGEPQCRPLLSNPDTHTAPPLQHILDLVLNDNDARCTASRHANTAAGSITRHRHHQDLRTAVDSQAAPAPSHAHTLQPYTDSYFTVTGLSPSTSVGP